MSKHFPLQSVRDLARNNADASAVALGRLQSQELQARERLAMLEACRMEYQAKLLSAGRGGIGQANLYNYHEFLAKLERAIAQQNEVLRAAETRTRAGLKDWQSRQIKLKSFDVLAQKHQQAEARLEARREQKLTDERYAATPSLDTDRR